jgi:hypothetical protein
MINFILGLFVVLLIIGIGLIIYYLYFNFYILSKEDEKERIRRNYSLYYDEDQQKELLTRDYYLGRRE